MGDAMEPRSGVVVDRRRSGMIVGGLCVLISVALVGCGGGPPAARTGFLGDYSNLEEVSSTRMRYISPRLVSYTSFMVDAPQARFSGGALSPEDRAEALRYFRGAFVGVVRGQGLVVTDRAGVGVARVRLALTDVAGSTWWLKLHPASRLAGAGTGGAAMEGEIIDSVTGEQLAAVVQSGSGNQFNLAAFSTLADVKGAIDGWAAQAADRLAEIRAQAGEGQRP